MKLKSLVAGVVGMFAVSTAALAADPVFIPPPASPPPMVVAPAGFDWSGLYAGPSALFMVGTQTGLLGYGGQVGFDVARGNFVFGAEVSAFRPIGAPGFFVLAGGRAGVTLGATDRLLAYGLALVAFPVNIPAPRVVAVGGGLAIGLGERLSVYGEVLVPLAAGSCCTVRAGLNFHFGN